MNESTTTTNVNTSNLNDVSTQTPNIRPPMLRTTSLPITPTSALATNPWYQQKFELFRDVIEEKIRDEYPNLEKEHKLQPINIEHSTLKGYDLDFPIDLQDGQRTIVSLSYGTGTRPAYTKDERRKLITIRQNTKI